MDSAPDPGVEVKLKQDLGLMEVIVIGLGPTLGSTIFLLIGFGLQITGPGLVLVMVLNFTIIMLSAISYAELSSSFSSSGGEYSWVREGLPEPIGFLSGWMIWFGNCIVTSFYILGFGKGAIWILEANNIFLALDTDLFVKALAAIACIVFIAINYKGVKETGKTSSLISLILVSIIVLFIIAGAVFLAGGKGDGDIRDIVNDPAPKGLAYVFVAMGFTFIVFEGFDLIAQCGEECKNPSRNIPRATWICVTLSTVLFILVSAICVGVLDWTTIGPGGIRGDDAVAEVARQILPAGTIIVGIGVIFGALAATNSTLFASSRVAFAMGRDRTLPGAFGKLHSKNSTPHIAIFVSGAIIIFMTLALPIEQIAASTAIMFLSVFMMVNLSAIILRYKKPEIKRLYRIPLFPVLPLVAIGALMILALALWEEYPNAWFIALAWVTVGLALYYFYGGKKAIEAVQPDELYRKGLLETIARKPEDKSYRILVAVTHEAQKPMVEFAALVARVEDADLNVVSVIEVPFGTPIDRIKYKETAPYIRLVEKVKKSSDKELVKARGTVLVSHAASDAILDTIREDNINLLIMGWKGVTAGNRALGTTVDKLARSADCDVVLMKTGLERSLKRILIVSAPEWHSSHAVGYAILLAKRDESEITLFGPGITDTHIERQQKHTGRLAELCKIHGIPHTVKIARTDSLERAIAEEARNHELVVMGSTLESDKRRFAFGRVQDSIIKSIDSPILIVKKVKKR